MYSSKTNVKYVAVEVRLSHRTMGLGLASIKLGGGSLHGLTKHAVGTLTRGNKAMTDSRNTFVFRLSRVVR